MKNKGLTLIEVMLCVAILVSLLVGLISLYIYCFDLQETSANISNASFQVQAKLEQIKQAAADNFDNIRYEIGESPLTGLNGKMKVMISTVYPPGAGTPSDVELCDVRIVAGWVQRAGRIIGEGRVSGSIFEFADLDGDFVFESPVEINCALGRKQ